MSVADDRCELCRDAGSEVLWCDALCRVVLVTDAADFPGFCRVIWNNHEQEMTDLDGPDRRHLMSVVYATEAALRACQQPDKINLASLGNQVPHLHWHVIPRWRDDTHFPNPIWGKAVRKPKARPPVDVEALRKILIQSLAEEQGGNA
jgi:diadenosine tetraphosphate (Ap4A) HIT family hydrolase